MSRLSLNGKAWSIVALLWVALIAAGVAGGLSTRGRMLDQRQAELSHQVQVAASLVAFYRNQAATHALSDDEARKQAIAALRALRYGDDNSGYFGIYDSRGYSVLNPLKPDIEGTDTSNLVDRNGTRVAMEIVKHSSPGGDHVSRYYWPKAGREGVVEKLTYAVMIPEWDWHLFTGAYLDDIDDVFIRTLVKNLALFAMIGLVVTAGQLWLIRSLRTGVGSLRDAIRQTSETLDLTQRAPVVNQDEVGVTAGAFNRLVDRVAGVMTTVHEATESVNTASSEMAAGNSDLSSRTEQQAASLEETASSMEQLTATVRQNADSAKQGNALALQASEVASQGGDAVGRVIETMKGISSSSEKVSEIIGVIEGIAFQTNILALNAAVEAARAGEQGRGFAVVASEVRGLAQRSATAAKEIKELIGASVEQVREGEAQVGDAGRTIDEVVRSVRQVADLMGEIAAASHEQQTGIEQVNQAVAQMDQVTQQNAALVEQAAAASQSMSEQARVLRAAVATFRVEAVTARAVPAGVKVAVSQPAAPAVTVVRRREPALAAPRPAAEPRAAAGKSVAEASDAAWETF
ncbi:methyl-accepting chemotaxis protein [Burkholderia sp. Ac-20379]|uniref:methyl-accepting chemotaxis protein n=1 Tax=Burkholderia sp. Ac-20379 TaxID=2703900 RepID=UPI0019822945|nr:methyl-accepting chemotaxis protein [Burkholderia sp. Ac-20379]MBN3728706.1 HAMP domain-containing protein [Burkholderia sp. Ac-20379]